MQNRLTFYADADAMGLVRPFVSEFVTRHAIASDDQARILIVLEELVTNIVKYGYVNRQGGYAEVALELDDTRLTMEIVDNADPFDPFKDAPAPDFDTAVEDREVGGLGIHIVRALTDEVHYARTEGRNVLQLTRRVTLIKA